MPKLFRVIIFLLIHSCNSAQPSLFDMPIESPVTLEKNTNLFQAGNVFFGGQPDIPVFKWLQQQGVSSVINLRTDIDIRKGRE